MNVTLVWIYVYKVEHWMMILIIENESQM